jgi:hypothetical protein
VRFFKPANILFVQPGTFLRFGLELSPKLLDFHPRCEASPAIFGAPYRAFYSAADLAERFPGFGNP